MQFQLLELREAQILEGPVFRFKARCIMGSNPQLEHTVIEVTSYAKTGSLYMYNPGNNKALEFIPIIQLRDIPQPASYFYNRIESTQPHLVSYHFAEQSDVLDTSTAIVDFLNEMKGS